MDSKGKILYVDDEIENLNFYSSILESEGYSVKTATNNEDAYNLLKQGPVDILLLDVVLKNESGLDLLRKIKSEEQFRLLISIIITGKLKSSKDQSIGFELGAELH